MSFYRFFPITGGFRGVFTEGEHASDEDAIRCAGELTTPYTSVEIWLGATLVGVVRETGPGGEARPPGRLH